MLYKVQLTVDIAHWELGPDAALSVISIQYSSSGTATQCVHRKEASVLEVVRGVDGNSSLYMVTW